MARRTDQVLVIDLEATCWEGDPPPGQESEIIEIGLCLVDVERLERVERRSLLVAPQGSTVSPFCTQLTTLTPASLEGAPPLADALRALKRDLDAPALAWASWGDYDRRQIERECLRKGLRSPLGPSHLNVKTLFALARGLAREVPLGEACAQLGVAFEGTPHRGVDDAWNIAGVLCALLRGARRGV